MFLSRKMSKWVISNFIAVLILLVSGLIYFCCKKQSAGMRGNQGNHDVPQEFNNLDHAVPVIEAAHDVVQNPQGMVHIYFFKNYLAFITWQVCD